MSASGRSDRPLSDPAPPPAEKSANGSRRVPEIRGSTRRGRTSRFGPAPLHEIGIAGLTRSRVAWFVGLLMIGWVVAGFLGQAGNTARATERAATVKAENSLLEAQVVALREEIALVDDASWVAQQARSFSLGNGREIPFVLAPDAAPLPADAPGSEARRLGTQIEARTPLETWLDVLFGAHD